jgi:two-component system NtrC family sensor kinase
MADYASIAIENASLYSETEVERSKLETILTQIEDGVIVLDEGYNVLLANRAARKIFHLGERDVTGLNFEKVFKDEDFIKAVRGEVENPYRVEVEIEKGRVHNVQVTTVPAVGILATLHDITYLKELDRIKTDFVNMVSHDLRSPLTAILGYVELIQRAGEVSPQQMEFIERIRLSVNNITTLITDLLDLGRIEVGLDEEIESVPLSLIISDAVDGLGERIKKKDQNLKLEIEGKLPSVAGNPVQLRQMLENLLNNAVKYTPEGGSIRLAGFEEDGQVILQVADTGPGIPTKEQRRIFDRFYRASNVTKDIQGTGLGLSIVKSIVDNHRGRIWVDSILGKGAVFTIVLPIEGKKTGLSRQLCQKRLDDVACVLRRMVGFDCDFWMGVSSDHLGNHDAVAVAAQHGFVQPQGIADLVAYPVGRGADLGDQRIALLDPFHVAGVDFHRVNNAFQMHDFGRRQQRGGDLMAIGLQGFDDHLVDVFVLASPGDRAGKIDLHG